MRASPPPACLLTSPSPRTSTRRAQEFDDVEAGEAIRTGLPVYQGSDLIKAGFVRKVYGILAVQLLFTVASSAFMMLGLDTSTRHSLIRNQGMMLFASLMPFGFLGALHCYKDRHPLNLGLLGGFTMCLSYTVGIVCAVYYESGYGMVVLEALILTAAVFLSLTAAVHVTKKDFSFMGGALFAGLIVLLVWSMLNMWLDFGLGGRMVFSLLGALLFVGYILYDTSMLMHHLGPDDYIIAAVSLYLDIINLFLYLLEILRMFGGGDN